jgi:hypothetical protein
VEWFLLFYIILILIFLFIVKIIRIHFKYIYIYIYIYIFLSCPHNGRGRGIRSCDFRFIRHGSQPIELQLGDHFKYIILWFSRGRLIG